MAKRPDQSSDDEAAPKLVLPLMTHWAPVRTIAGFHLLDDKERFAFTLVIAVAAGLFLPFLGSTGFYDPWESHYAEVARQMVARNDYIYPFWKDAHFFSKPVLLFWLTAPLYALLGAGHVDRELPALMELCGRLPIALMAILTVALIFAAARRLWSLRAAVISSLVLCTTPYFFFIARQAITDMLYVGPMSGALCLVAIAFFDDDTRDKLKDAPIPRWLIVVFGLLLLPQLWEIGRSGAFLNRVALLGSEVVTRVAFSALLCAVAIAGLVWLARRGKDPLLHAAAALVAVGTLGKGPVALALTGFVVFIYLLVNWEWARLKRAGMVSAIVLYFAIATPWFLVMLLFDGKDEGRKTWFQRFVLYDLFGRIGGGVHGERGTFDYYVRYFGYGGFPWSPLVPVALLDAARVRKQKGADLDKGQRFTLFCAIWAIALFAFFVFTTTKFHHYIFPVVVPSALLIGRWLDQALDSDSRVPVGIGVFLVLCSLVIGRDLVAEPWQLADLYSYHYVSYKPSYYFPQDLFWRTSIGLVTALATALIALGMASDGFQERWAKKLRDMAEPPSQPVAGMPSAAVTSATPVPALIICAIFAAAFVVSAVFVNGGAGHDWIEGWLRATVMPKAFGPINPSQMATGIGYGVTFVGALAATILYVSAGLGPARDLPSLRESFRVLLSIPAAVGRALFAGAAPAKNAGLVGCMLLAGLVFAVYGVFVYQNTMSQHWSHRWLLKTYWAQSKPGEPLLSYQMDWKGETFYSHNTERQIKKSATKLRKAVEEPGTAWVLVQQDRYNRLKSAVGPAHADKLTVVDRSNTKWFLVRVDD